MKNLKTMMRNNGNGSTKTYKTIENAKKELNRIDGLISEESNEIVQYCICVNDSGRFFIQFFVRVNASVSFHFFIHQGHSVSVN